jgi:hypothetical protein
LISVFSRDLQGQTDAKALFSSIDYILRTALILVLNRRTDESGALGFPEKSGGQYPTGPGTADHHSWHTLWQLRLSCLSMITMSGLPDGEEQALDILRPLNRLT